MLRLTYLDWLVVRSSEVLGRLSIALLSLGQSDLALHSSPIYRLFPSPSLYLTGATLDPVGCRKSVPERAHDLFGFGF